MGRTGVFITLSIVLERMRYEGVVDMFQTVKTLRTQRPAMVQTEVCRPEGGTHVSLLQPTAAPAAGPRVFVLLIALWYCLSHMACREEERELCSFRSPFLSASVSCCLWGQK